MLVVLSIEAMDGVLIEGGRDWIDKELGPEIIGAAWRGISRNIISRC